jgi:5'-3' exonuclease
MGIPSYYKKLVTILPSLIGRSHPSIGIDWLFMDFNCLIYHCLHRADTPVYPGDHQKEEWEAQFIECIVRYCIKMIRQVDPKMGVFLAIDGVVPMAKMRQQRLRRFKSVWLQQQEKKGEVKWDTNAITPGTLFMKKLHAGLEKMIKEKGKGTWRLSSSDEPGEGEHKIMSAWRTGQYKGSTAVYGLDADLIVLSLLGQTDQPIWQAMQPIWLFREEIEMGKIAYDSTGEEQMEWFSIDVLRDWLSSESQDKRSFLLDYCFAMSILGNDFLPSSLGLKMRDDGHTELLTVLRDPKRVPLINGSEVSIEGLQYLFRTLSGNEETRIQKYIGKKQYFSRGAQETDLGQNNWPLHHIEEEILLDSQKRSLAPKWKEKYKGLFSSYLRSVEQYLYGIQWIWAYYTGKLEDVCFNWYYPFSLPPLWESLRTAPLPAFPLNVLVRAQDIRPVEQLALVLPLESWSLIQPCKERKFPSLAPQFYPSVYSFESMGKRFFWECESMIPLPSIYELKRLCE